MPTSAQRRLQEMARLTQEHHVLLQKLKAGGAGVRRYRPRAPKQKRSQRPGREPGR